jgi:L-fuculose-phosphate aldolase
MMQEEIVPNDFEGSYLLKKVPVINAEKNMGPEAAAAVVSNALREHNVVVVRGHGSFARGDTPEEAFMFTSSLEASSFYVYHMQERPQGTSVPGASKKRGRRPL